mgnify:FL=1
MDEQECQIEPQMLCKQVALEDDNPVHVRTNSTSYQYVSHSIAQIVNSPSHHIRHALSMFQFTVHLRDRANKNDILHQAHTFAAKFEIDHVQAGSQSVNTNLLPSGIEVAGRHSCLRDTNQQAREFV